MGLGNTKEETVKKIILSAIATSALVCAGGASAQTTKATTPMNTMSHMTSSKAMPAKTTTSHVRPSHKTISRTEEKTESKAQERSEAKAHSMRHHHHRRHHESAAQVSRESRHHGAKPHGGAVTKTTSVTATTIKK